MSLGQSLPFIQPGTSSHIQNPDKIDQERIRYEKARQSPLARELAASCASPRPAMRSGPIPPTMFPPTTPPRPSKSAALPPILSGSKTHRRELPVIPGRSTSIRRWPRSATSPTNSPATAAATAPWATPACAVALKTCTAPSAPPARKKAYSPTSRPSSARLAGARSAAAIARHEYETIDLEKQ